MIALFCRASMLMLFIPSLAATSVASAAEAIAILPSEIRLSGPQARQTLLVQVVRDGLTAEQIADGVEYRSSDEAVVRIENGVAVPAGDGRATITATAGEWTAQAAVTVEKFAEPFVWSFRNHVQSVISKAGCNTGACHGAAAGKNGFRLSLRGYDPEFDYLSITRQSRGRRIVPGDPGRSLLLTKPTGAVPHKGGLRFAVDSIEHRVLAEWLAAGHPGPTEADIRVERLEILPAQATLRPGAQQQMVVLAHFDDGHVEDVTRWARYTATNVSAAEVDDAGRVKVTGHGEGAVVAWYLAKTVVATITSPYAHEIPAEVFAEAPRSNPIDDLVLAKLREINIPPSPPAADGAFLRRAYLDTIGTLPTAEETRAFVADKSPDKYDRLADYLLTRPEFVDYWAYKWSDLLLVSGDRLRPKAVEAYYGWIRARVADGTPWDEFARQIVTAKGSTLENGAANFYSLHQEPLDMAETVSMAFLGMSIQCARCHDHPMEKWTNDQYYGMANLFARVRGKGWGGDFRNGDGDRMVFTVDRGELIQPRTGRPQPPTPLDGEPLPFDAAEDRRIHLANWLVSPENPYFSRAIVNRVWANYFGVGIVETVDDMRLTNPPSNEALLAELADALVEGKFRLKPLMRLILTSQTYRRSSRPVAGNETDGRFYSRYYPKRLKAEVMLDAVSQATGVPTKFNGYPEGTRALQLRDASVDSYFLNTFGRPERVLTCECERSNEPSMKQVLHLMNGQTLNDKLSAGESRVAKQLAAGLPLEQIVDEAYLACLSRLPTTAEKTGLLDVLSAVPEDDRRLVLEDLYWSILSSREFLFNH